MTRLVEGPPHTGPFLASRRGERPGVQKPGPGLVQLPRERPPPTAPPGPPRRRQQSKQARAPQEPHGPHGTARARKPRLLRTQPHVAARDHPVSVPLSRPQAHPMRPEPRGHHGPVPCAQSRGDRAYVAQGARLIAGPDECECTRDTGCPCPLEKAQTCPYPRRLPLLARGSPSVSVPLGGGPSHGQGPGPQTH